MNASPVRSTTSRIVSITRGSSSRSRPGAVVRSSAPVSQMIDTVGRRSQRTTRVSLSELWSACTRSCVRCMPLQPSARCMRPSPRAKVTQTAAPPGVKVMRSAPPDADDTNLPLAAPVGKRMTHADTACLGHDGAMSHRVVVIGGGFGGLRTVQGLRGVGVEITLIDRRNFHLFQPLTYQVATGALSPGEIAYPLRALFKDRSDVRVLQANVEGIDAGTRPVRLEGIDDLEPAPISYDTLVVAAGSAYSYFGHEEWREIAAEVKSLESALSVRSRVLAAFERAELSDDPAIDAAELTFVVVGAGPTGVEMAGQIAELARDTLRNDFRSIDPAHARILLVEATDQVLGSFPRSLSRSAVRALERLGVTVMVNHTVTGINHTEVTLRATDGTEQRVASRTVVWAAGVTASPLARLLGEIASDEV